jgi:hypothetical protein
VRIKLNLLTPTRKVKVYINKKRKFRSIYYISVIDRVVRYSWADSASLDNLA